jgi:hypothetical protein
MSRNPYARSLRVKPQQVISDKREKTYREHLQETVEEEIPERFKRLLDRLA